MVAMVSRCRDTPYRSRWIKLEVCAVDLTFENEMSHTLIAGFLPNMAIITYFNLIAGFGPIMHIWLISPNSARLNLIFRQSRGQ